MQMERWVIHSDIVKYMQYNQHPIGNYGLVVKAPEERYGTKMCTKLQDRERSRK